MIFSLQFNFFKIQIIFSILKFEFENFKNIFHILFFLELIESVMYLYRATGDSYLLEIGEDMLRSIQHSAKTSCGFATVGRTDLFL